MHQRVAIIGAGPSGIVAARFLLQEGLQPTIFEQSDQPGGQFTALERQLLELITP